MSDPEVLPPEPSRATTGTSTVADRIPAHGTGRLAPMWQKGQSGNPLGVRRAEYERVRAVCADASMRAVERQLELMESDDERVALMATEAILNRGVGKPRDHSADQPTTVDLSALSTEERLSLVELLRRAMGRG